MLSELSTDCRYAVRALLRSPGFAAAAILTIALGVGVNAGIFTILNGVLFRDVPAPAAHELVSIEQSVEGAEFTAMAGAGTFTIADYRVYADRAQTLSELAAYSSPRETTLGGEAPQKVYGALVSCNYFAMLHAVPQRGRALGAQDCEPGAEPVVVLGHSLWTTAFASDSAVIGQTVELAGNRFTVVGVAAEGTYGGSPVQTAYFAPLNTEPLLWPGDSRYDDERYRWLLLLGRRAGGATTARVRAELGVFAAQIDALEPGRSTTLDVARASPATLPGNLRGPATGAAAVLLGAFGLILLIACANVANLSLARGTARGRELGVRLALGASRARIVRQLMTESLLLSVAGGALGSLLALWSFQALVALALPTAIHPEVPVPALELDFSPDFRVLWYALGITIATGLLFGLAPALQASRPDLNTVIKRDAAGAGGVRGGRLRGTLIGVQIALCMALMMATGLLLRGLQATYTIDPGFAIAGVAHLSFGTDGSPSFLDRRFLDDVAALPGVESAAFASQTPLGESVTGFLIRLPGDAEDEFRIAEADAVTPSFFSMLEIPIVRGRNFTDAESADAAQETATRPAIVSATTARNLWGEADPLGRTLLFDDTTLQIVGVAADARLGGLGSVDPYYIYLPRADGLGGELLFRSRGDLGATAAGVLALVRARDAAAVARVLPLEANLAWFRGLSRLVTILGAGLGLLALALATVGVYAIVSYAVTTRYRELGIRVALGARARDLLEMILRRSLRPVAIGAVAGIAVTVLLTRVLASVLFGVSPADPIGLGGAALLVLGVASGAAALAALPAARAEPTNALRYD